MHTLNLSSVNEVGDKSSATLLAYLGFEECVLRSLLLHNADFDDCERGSLMKALETNFYSVTCLDLERQRDRHCGEPERGERRPHHERRSHRDGVLRVNTTFTSPDLSWNAIRGNSAEDLTK